MAGKKAASPFTDEEILAELKKLGHYDVSPEIFQLMKKDLSKLMAKNQRYVSSVLSKNSFKVKDSAAAFVCNEADIKQSFTRASIHQQFKKTVKTSEEELSDSCSRSPTSSPSVDARISKYKNSFAAYKLKKNAVYPSDTIHEIESDVSTSYDTSPIRKYTSTLNKYRAQKILNSPVKSVNNFHGDKNSICVTSSIQDHLVRKEIHDEIATNVDLSVVENGARNDSQNSSPIRLYTNLRHFEKEKEPVKIQSDDNDSKTSVSLNKYKDSLKNYKMRRYTVKNCNEKGNATQINSSVAEKKNNPLPDQQIVNGTELNANVTTAKNSQGNKIFQNSGKMKTFIKSSDFIDSVDVSAIPIINDSNGCFKNDNQIISSNNKSDSIGADESTLSNTDSSNDDIGRTSRSPLQKYNEVQSSSSAKKKTATTENNPKNVTAKVKGISENSSSDSKPTCSLRNFEKDEKHLSDNHADDDDEVYNPSPSLESIQRYKDSVNMFKLKKKYANATNLVKQTECSSVSPTVNPINKYRDTLYNLKLRSYIQNAPRYTGRTQGLADLSQTSTSSSSSQNSKTIKRKILRRVNGVAVVTEEMLQIPVILDTSYPESDSLPSNKSYSSDDLSFQSNDSTGSVNATSPKAISNSQSTSSLASLSLMPSRIPVQRKKKNDPVAMYGYYQKYWKNFKPPGEKTHDKLRWAVRDKMLEYHL